MKPYLEVPPKIDLLSSAAHFNLNLSFIVYVFTQKDVNSFRSELWSLSLAGSALSIACDNDGNVCLSLMDGSVAFLTVSGLIHWCGTCFRTFAF